MENQNRTVAGTWWAGLTPEEFYKIVHAKEDELRRDERFGTDRPKGNGPGKPPSTRPSIGVTAK